MNTSSNARRNGRRKGGSAPRDHYQEVTDRIIAAIEAGTPPWRKPWDPDKAGGPAMPRNAVSGHRYRGINVLTLGMSPLAFLTGDPRWATYKQARERGWQVRGGEHGTTGILLQEARAARRHEAGRRRRFRAAYPAAARLHAVPREPDRGHSGLHSADDRGSAVARAGGGGDHPRQQRRGAPHRRRPRVLFAGDGSHSDAAASGLRNGARLCGTLLHELRHWTGAPSRLDRDLRNRFGSHDYAREELRAEIGQVMVCAELGIAECDFSNNAAYVAGWLEKLRDDRKEIFRAASDAQRIADYLLAFHPDYANGVTGPPESEPAAEDGDADATPEAMPVAA